MNILYSAYNMPIVELDKSLLWKTCQRLDYTDIYVGRIHFL